MANADQTQAAINNHLQSFARKSVDGVLSDFSDNSVLILPTGQLRGLGEIRNFFATFINGLPAGFLEAFKLHKLEIVDEFGYIVWEAAPWILLATDTVYVRDGKILRQTFASYPAYPPGV